jgi:hypothetical protein
MDQLINSEIREALQKVCDRHGMTMADVIYRVLNMKIGEGSENISGGGLDVNDYGLPGSREEGTSAGNAVGVHRDDGNAAPAPGVLDQHALRGEE